MNSDVKMSEESVSIHLSGKTEIKFTVRVESICNSLFNKGIDPRQMVHFLRESVDLMTAGLEIRKKQLSDEQYCREQKCINEADIMLQILEREIATFKL